MKTSELEHKIAIYLAEFGKFYLIKETKRHYYFRKNGAIIKIDKKLLGK